MNIKIQFAIFLTLAIFLLSCCSSPTSQLSDIPGNDSKSCCVTNTDPAALRILCFGDSITQGVGATFQGGYRGPLKMLLGQAGTETDFVGTSGIGSASSTLPDPEHEGNGGRRLSQMIKINEIFAKNRNLDIVIILMGINDLIENRNSVDITISKMNDLLDQIAKNTPAARIFVGNLIPNASDNPVTEYDPSRQYVSSEDKVVKFNSKLPSVIEEKKLNGMRIEMVDLHSRLTIHDLSDGIHPNIQGHNKIARAWFEAITTGN